MPNIISGSAIVSGHTNTHNTLLPAAGSNRRWIVGQSIEQSNQDVADWEFTSVTMRGQTATKILGAWAGANNARGLELFEFTETQIQAIEAAGSGDIVFSNSSGAIPAGAYEQTFCFTLADCEQGAITASKVELLNTGGTPADALPHEHTVTGALSGQLAVFVAHCSQPSTAAWSGATEFLDTTAGTFATHGAAVDVAADGDVTAGISPDGGVSYATSIIGFAISAATASNTDPALDTPISDIIVPSNTSGTIADISGNFSDANSDPLTYSVTPALPSGMTLNTTTGVISGNGSITVTAAANYTFSADDGNGGTPASDVVSITVTAVADQISSIADLTAGSTATLTTDGTTDLTASSTATVSIDGGSALLVTPVTATTGTFTVPTDGFELGSAVSVVLTVDGNSSSAFSDTFAPALGAFVTLTVGYADLHPDSPLYGNAAFSALVAGDQIEYETTTNEGYSVSVSSDGLVTITGAGADPDPQLVQYAIIDASDTYSRGTVGTWTFGSADTTPDQFDLGADVTGAEPGAVTTRTFTVAGIDSGETISFTATGDASVSPSTGQLGDTITVTLTAGPFGTTVTGGVTSGGVSDSFSVTSRAAVTPTIDTQPTNQTVNEGATATFTAAFTNAASIQWYDASDDSALTGETSASLSITTVLADNGNTYYAIATSADAQTAQTNTVTLTVNEVVVVTPPTMPAATTATVAEGSTAVGTYTASSGDAPITYTLGGTDAASFTINGSTGVVAFSSAPDYETKSSYSFTVIATNSAGSDSQVVTVTVTNVVEQAPAINTGGSTSITITEGNSYSDPVWTWSDDVVSGQSVTWSGDTVNSSTTAGTYTRTATATNAFGTTTQDYTITVVVASEFVDAPEIVRVTAGQPKVYIHNGSEIPTTQPMDTNAHIWKQFTLDNLITGETLTGTPAVLINDTVVTAGDTVESMTFREVQTNGSNKIKVRLQGASEGKLYTLTVRYSTTYTPSDDKSQQFYGKRL